AGRCSHAAGDGTYRRGGRAMHRDETARRVKNLTLVELCRSHHSYRMYVLDGAVKYNWPPLPGVPAPAGAPPSAFSFAPLAPGGRQVNDQGSPGGPLSLGRHPDWPAFEPVTRQVTSEVTALAGPMP